jgi:DNA (cytosine-5)-methyltransferase 1
VPLRFVDLFAGLGGFHIALTQLGHKCVFASEIDPELRKLYTNNFADARNWTVGDIRQHKQDVPAHDILCAGFPCQPFSKSGFQLGLRDQTRGTLFSEILDILESHKPQYVILENVGNFERHDKGRTWQVVRKSLERLDYSVAGTEHISSGGPGLLSPHHFGYPHNRERFFVVASRNDLPNRPFPVPVRNSETSLESIIQADEELSSTDRLETHLSERQVKCIELWNEFLQFLPSKCPLPSFPIWSDELGAKYPFQSVTPYASNEADLRASLNGQAEGSISTKELMYLLPSYARQSVEKFPDWKTRFIKQNRDWFADNKEYFPVEWIERLRAFPSSLRKLEWNCQGCERDLWKHVLQFRPSGLRVKRCTSSPALVAMTTTQIPIYGPKKRFISRVEGLRLQGLPDGHLLPHRHDAAFRALGNAVHVKVVQLIASTLLSPVELSPLQETFDPHD